LFVVPALAGFEPQIPPKGGTTNDFAVLLAEIALGGKSLEEYTDFGIK
jgi:hypothetical protein